jgi:hypothetical protein
LHVAQLPSGSALTGVLSVAVRCCASCGVAGSSARLALAGGTGSEAVNDRAFFVAFWTSRPESPASGASRLAAYLEGLRGIDGHLGHWRLVRERQQVRMRQVQQQADAFVAGGVIPARD